MIDLKFDNTTISNTTYFLEYSKHQTAPDRDLELVRLPNRSGEVLISNNFRSKRILLRGVILGTSPSDLQSKVDTFKELFSREAKNLDITPDGGSIRRYIATCSSHTFDQESYNVTHMPWEAEFIVPSGEGKATSSTTYSDDDITSSPHTDDIGLILAGSKKPQPVIVMTIDSETNMTKLKFTNNTTDQYIEVTRAFANAEVLTIDCENMTCQVGGVDVDFDGVFPKFDIGTNSYTLTTTDTGAFNIDLDVTYYLTYL